MSPQPRSGAARTAAGAANPRLGARTAPPRRVSGPARPVRPRVAPAPAPHRRRGNTDAFERLKALPESRLLDRLIRGRSCIWLIALMLGGIVAMQVSMLKLNTGISRAVESTTTLQRQNSSLEEQISRLSSSDRIRANAVKAGMVDPSAGDVRFLRARGGFDARSAAQRIAAPSVDAKAVMANNGYAPGVVRADTTVGGQTTDALTGTGTATAATATTATGAATTATGTATAVPTATPMATATAVATATATVAPAVADTTAPAAAAGTSTTTTP